MQEQELVRDTYDELTEIYGENRVVVEPTVKGKVTFSPDIAVLDESEDDFYLIVECSTLTSQHREREDLKQLRKLMEDTDSPYGALVSHSIRYIFELVEQDGERVERELSTFPGEESQGQRPLESAEEIQFKLWRLAENFRGMQRFELVKNLYYSLFRKLAAERHDYPIDTDTLSQDDLEEIDTIIEEEYPPFSSHGVRSSDVDFQKQVLNIFNEVDLDNTPRDLSQVFVEFGEQDKSRFQSTPLWISQALVNLTDVDDDDLVLDPAAGIGNILRETGRLGADPYGVEINVDAANCGIFLNELFDTSVSYKLGDFLELSEGDDLSEFFPGKFDYGFIDPPFGLQYERSDGEIIHSAEEQFVLNTLDHLKPGGILTFILPAGTLFKQRSSDFREKLRSEYKLESLIEIEPPIFERTSIPTVILQVVNEPPSDSHEVSYAVIESDENPRKELPKVVDDIRLGNADTMPLTRFEGRSFLPSEITQLDEVSLELNKKFSEVKEFQEVADQIRGGTKKPDQVFESPGDGRLPYVNISDIQQGGFSEYIPVTDNVVVADETDVLLSTSGAKIHVYHPSREIAPSSMWAVIRFSSESEALVYAQFLDTDLARQQLGAMQSGSAIQHIPIRRLREMMIPAFSDQEIAQKEEKIRRRLDQISDLERKQAELEEDLGEFFEG